MKKRSHPKKIGFDFRWVFRLSILVGVSYLIYRFSTNTDVLAIGIGLVAFGLSGLMVAWCIKHYRRDAFECFSAAEVIRMKMPAGWQSAYESVVTFLMGRWGSNIFVGSWLALGISAGFLRSQKIFGLNLGRIAVGYFFGYILLLIIGGFLGWEDMVERQRRDRKLKPIPERGDKIELYDFASGKPLAYISSNELEFLIDSFREWGMADNDFYIMRETVDLFEERGADAHLVATLREMMGQQNDLEIGWTLV